MALGTAKAGQGAGVEQQRSSFALLWVQTCLDASARVVEKSVQTSLDPQKQRIGRPTR
jgi:hypothetical protein